jgi:D-3-phosphoglycerate dehydrogenase
MNIICLSPLDNVPEVKQGLDDLGDLLYVPGISLENLVNAIKDYDKCVIYCNPNIMSFRLDEKILSSKIIAISTASTGTDHIDLELCKKLDIKVFSLVGDQILSKISSTAEMSLALMLSLIRNIPSAFDSVKAGEWLQIPFTGRELKDMMVGIIGYGRLGSKMVSYCRSLGMHVAVCDPYKQVPYPNLSLEDISKICHAVSLHVHLDDETYHMIDRKFLNGRISYVVNTSRGPIVNESDIIDALENKKLLGYAADVVEDEFSDMSNSKIIQRSKDLNIIITPHIAGTTVEAHRIAFGKALDNIKKFLSSCSESK